MFSSKFLSLSKFLYNTLGAGVKLESGVSTVLILGGSTSGFGIELSAALMFEHNVCVINVDSRDFEMILNVNEAVKLEKYYTFIHCNDFSNMDNMVQAMTEVAKLKLPINFFINNVQEGLHTVFDSHEDNTIGYKGVAHLRKCVNANLTNVMIATKMFLNTIVPQTARLTRGKISQFYIVNISSVLSLQLPEFARHFTSSKAALNQFHDSLTSELSFESGEISTKTLLAYLPNIRDGEAWEVNLTEMTDALIQDLKDGKQGDTILKCDPKDYSKDTTRNNVRYRLGNLHHNWL
ncbi:hypothetical protein HG535_0D01160 [Zygotorulaspora mrakii]|uniref:Oxidoreductase n=1 Tax=Zygotorulaspora mrakii TaxID=42260 RepID=A0A7H9B194_ZYGMR|nr:uncharacterized protein HG535_0D01160 [Zygotorulaspora mrakii]QLG72408.1 hypothetical protein HG535_0D01160 [Zygotorulaspora mrakii]